MLNMQNVKDIEITEGDVRTIHDKDSRLIWGRLAYDTKYAGDTFQQTYSGKNLLPYPYNGSGNEHGITFTFNNDGTILLNGQNDGIGNSAKYFIETADSPLTLPAGTYYFIPPSVPAVHFVATDLSSYYLFQASNNWTYTFNSSVTIRRFYIEVSKNNTAVFDNTKIYPMLSTLPNQTEADYEPYTGGIPAPNPDYPQNVQVVTGEQTVTIGDGVTSHDYTLNFGSIELCKIGDYQDYIYKSNGDWYVHKACDSSLLGGFTWTAQNTYNSTTIKKMSTDGLSGVYLPPTNSSTTILAYCTHYQAETEANVNLRNMGLSGRTNGNDIFIYDPDYNTSSSPSNFKTWLSNNSVALYYVLATPTDTKITDATLIGQLNAVHEWLTRYGYSSTVTGNLPIIINQTNL